MKSLLSPEKEIEPPSPSASSPKDVPVPSRVLGWQDSVLDNVSSQNPTPRFRRSQSIMGGAVPGHQVLDEQCWNILSATPVSTCLSVPVVRSCEPFQHDTSVLRLPWHDRPELPVAVLCMSSPGGWSFTHLFMHFFHSAFIHSFPLSHPIGISALTYSTLSFWSNPTPKSVPPPGLVSGISAPQLQQPETWESLLTPPSSSMSIHHQVLLVPSAKFQCCLCHPLPGWPWASWLTSLCPFPKLHGNNIATSETAVGDRI